ncbi:MAG TPA: RidA family protein [Candidatus Acidoferrales bacterium]|nr:RidA family protein [Candidatus Acidoferrales bacterium]
MSAITRVSSNAPWEPIVAYSRLVRAGDFVAVSGTTAFDERGLIVGAGQMYVQARQALNNIRAALERVGLSMSDVVRTRMFVTDIARFEEAARAHREFFADSRPATSMVEVRRLVSPAMMIEIEADAYAGGAGTMPERSQAASKRTAPRKKIAKKKSAKKPARRR